MTNLEILEEIFTWDARPSPDLLKRFQKSIGLQNLTGP